MHYDLVTHGATVVVSPRERLDDSERAEFDGLLDRVLAMSPTLIVFDCTALTYLDSAGLALLLTLRERARHAGAEVVLRGPRGAVRDILTLARFGELFHIDDGI